MNHLIHLLSEKLKILISISLGIFFFILFFQPFPLDRFDFNNNLLFVAGFGAIIFLFIFLFRIIYPTNILKDSDNISEIIAPTYFGDFIILSLSSVSFSFYLRYVGFVEISFFIVFKIVLICFVAIVVLRLNDLFHNIKQQNLFLSNEVKIIKEQAQKCEDDILNQSIEIISDDHAENLNLRIADIAFIKSADNYVEITYFDNEVIKRSLIRNTMKNIEMQLKMFSVFVRCHRICIVNILYVEKLHRNYSKTWLTIKNCEEQIPVSRQYLLRIKEAL